MEIKYVKTINQNGEVGIGAIYQDNMVGFLRYKVLKNEIFLYNVEVEKSFRHSKDKIGSTLLHIFENSCACKNLSITGKFYPKGEDGEVVKNFYIKNGYSIDRDGYDLMIFKYGIQKHDLNVDVEEIDEEKYNSYFNKFIALENQSENT